MDRWNLYNQVCEKLAEETDPDVIIELLGLTSEELVNAFESTIDERLDILVRYFNIHDSEE